MTKHRNTNIVVGEYPEGTDNYSLNQPKSLACYDYETNTIIFDNWGLEQNRQWVERYDIFEHMLDILHHEMLHQAIYKVAGRQIAHISHNLNIKYRKDLWDLV